MTESPSKLQFLDIIVNRINVGIVVVNRQFEVVLWNQFLANYSHVAARDVTGKPLFELFDDLPANWLRSKIEHVFELKNFSFSSWQQRPYLFKFPHNRPLTGDVDHMRQNCTFIPLRNDDNEVDHVCITITDATDTSLYEAMLGDAVKQLSIASTIDSLTQIPNRRHLESELQREWDRARRYQNRFCFLLADIDHFKAINDKHGHQAGDKVLQEFSEQLKASIREPDRIGRYGGEEFAIILPQTDLNGARMLAQRLCDTIAQYDFQINDTTIKVTISIGISEYHLDEQDSLESIISRADKALYCAKSNGRNQVSTEEVENTAAEPEGQLSASTPTASEQNVIHITIGHH